MPTQRDLVQVLNPKTDRYTLVDRAHGKILKQKCTAGPYKGVPIATRRTPDEERERTAEHLRKAAERKRDEQHFVTRDPKVCFGEPQVWGVNTAVIAGRYQAGDNDIAALAEDFGLSVWQVHIALAYEHVIIDRTAALVLGQ